jgi:hypothetical protein
LPSLIHSGHSIITSHIFSLGSIVGLDTIRDLINMRPHFLGTFLVDVLLMGMLIFRKIATAIRVVA